MTKDESSNTNLYASTTAVDTLQNLAENPSEQLGQWQDNVTSVADASAWKQVVENGNTVITRTKRVYESLGTNLDGSFEQKLGQTGEQLVDGVMVQTGMTEAQANAFLKENPEIVLIAAQIEIAREGLSDTEAVALNQVGDAVNDITETQLDMALAPDDEQSFTINGTQIDTPLEKAVMVLGDAQQLMDNLYASNPEAAKLAELAIGFATGGIVKTAVTEAVNPAIEAVVGEQMSEAYETVTNHAGALITASDDTAETFAQNKAETGEDGKQAKIQAGAGFAITSLLGVELARKVAKSESKGSKTNSERRVQNSDDLTLVSERAARRQAFRENNVPTTQANNFSRIEVHGKNENLKGPNGEPSQVIRTTDVNGKPVEIQHHSNGHQFEDSNTHELPHYHGKSSNHISYE